MPTVDVQFPQFCTHIGKQSMLFNFISEALNTISVRKCSSEQSGGLL